MSEWATGQAAPGLGWSGVPGGSDVRAGDGPGRARSGVERGPWRKRCPSGRRDRPLQGWGGAGSLEEATSERAKGQAAPGLGVERGPAGRCR